MFVSKVLILVLFLCHTALAEDDYYWEDYDPISNQSISSDALVAGKDANQRNKYIGQSTVDGSEGLWVGGVMPGEKVKFDDAGTSRVTSTKVLCSKHPEKFKWIVGFRGEKVKDKNDNSSGGFGLLEGGKDISDHIYYIGRVKRVERDEIGGGKYEKSDEIGGVSSSDTWKQHWNLLYELHYYVPKKGSLMAYIYEVLVFKFK